MCIISYETAVEFIGLRFVAWNAAARVSQVWHLKHRIFSWVFSGVMLICKGSTPMSGPGEYLVRSCWNEVHIAA